MRDTECVAFLRWALPAIGLDWRGFRRVRGQVCKRLGRRLAALGLGDLAAYRVYLGAEAAEWARLDELCRVSIARFYRDRAVFDGLRARLLPALARRARLGGASSLRAWSAGCAGGEEPYTLALLWNLDVGPHGFPGLALDITATDADPRALERARRATYHAGTLKELPPGWRDAAFEDEGGLFRLRDQLRAGVAFACQDIRAVMPAGPFDLILCRNLVYTYFDGATQSRVTEGLRRRLAPGGALIVGAHERVDPPAAGLTPDAACRGCYVHEAPAGPPSIS
jgi:chemotaxis protein methyltransferase CheR